MFRLYVHLVVETAGRIHLACGKDVERIISWFQQTTVDAGRMTCPHCRVALEARHA